MIEWRLDRLADTIGGTMCDARLGSRTFRGVSIDSRTIKDGELFIAIRGEHNNGHHYIDQAVARGAGGVVVEDSAALSDALGAGIGLVSVKDTREAMMMLARDYRRSSGARFAAITGSNGKTTTKELTYQLMRSVEERCYRSPGNLNNLFGAPLALFAMPAEAAVAVIELGISTPGEMSRLADIVQPDLILITNVGPSHLEFLGSVQAVARAKLELVTAVSREVPLIVNADDPVLMQETRRIRSHPITFAVAGKADFTVQTVEEKPVGGSRVVIDELVFHLPLVGRHQVSNLLAAYAVCRTLGYRFADVNTESLVFETAPMRGQLVRVNGVTLFADCYNANPVSVKAGLEAFFALSGGRRRIVILGDMLELGAQSVAYHEEMGRALSTYQFDLAVFVGNLSRHAMSGLRAAGGQDRKVRFYETAEGCSREMAGYFVDGDFVFLKGSRGIGLEVVMAAVAPGWEVG